MTAAAPPLSCDPATPLSTSGPSTLLISSLSSRGCSGIYRSEYVRVTVAFSESPSASVRSFPTVLLGCTRMRHDPGWAALPIVAIGFLLATLAMGGVQLFLWVLS